MKENYFNENLIEYKPKETISALKLGEIEDLRVTAEMPVDDIVCFGLDEGFLKEGLVSFPDPRREKSDCRCREKINCESF